LLTGILSPGGIACLSSQNHLQSSLRGKNLKCHPLFPNIFYYKFPGARKDRGINQARIDKIRRDLTIGRLKVDYISNIGHGRTDSFGLNMPVAFYLCKTI
jgi:hypothetical protein